MAATLCTIGGYAAVPSAAAKPYACQGLKPSIVGTAGKDRLRGTGKEDVIAGRGGNDSISRLGPGDVICGGEGRDRLRVKRHHSRSALRGEPSVENKATLVELGDGNDVATVMCPDNDSLFWGWIIEGGAGDDRIDINCARGDTAVGDAGEDTLIVGNGHDSAYGGEGDDLIEDAYSVGDECDPDIPPLGFVSPVPDRRCVRGCPEQSNPFCAGIFDPWEDRLHGDEGNDRVIGGDGPDEVAGDVNWGEAGPAGRDVLSGGAGGDALIGGPGYDECDGGSGDTDMNGWAAPYSTMGVKPDCEKRSSIEYE